MPVSAIMRQTPRNPLGRSGLMEAGPRSETLNTSEETTGSVCGFAEHSGNDNQQHGRYWRAVGDDVDDARNELSDHQDCELPELQPA